MATPGMLAPTGVRELLEVCVQLHLIEMMYLGTYTSVTLPNYATNVMLPVLMNKMAGSLTRSWLQDH